MGGKIRKQPDEAQRASDAAPDCADGDPFDRWLTRELAALHAADAARPLPDEILDLAARLEARLRAIGARRGKPPT